MRRPDWTPIVLITASLSVTVVIAVFLTSPFLPSPFKNEPGPTLARRELAPKISVWVGDIEPGLVALLSPVWGERGPDAAHDARLNAELGLPEGTDLGWYQLLVFNTTKEDRAFSLADGALKMRADADSAWIGLRSLAPLVARGEATPSPALVAVLHPRGSLQESVAVPAGWMANLLVAFDRRVALDEVVEVASATGSAFRRRQKERRELEGLVEDPDDAVLEDL